MRTIICSGMIVIGILMMRKAAMEKISRKLQYAIWLSLPAFLFLSSYISIDVPVRIEKTANVKETVQEVQEQYENAEIIVNHEESQIENNLENINLDVAKPSKQLANPSYDTKEIWSAIKQYVSLLMIILYAINNIVFLIYLLRNRQFYKKDKTTGLKLYLINNLRTPFLFGKSVYLHPEMTKDSSKMQYMVLHEFCHCKQGDTWWNILKYSCCAIFWFNPFVWLAAHFVSRDCELACDEAVIKIVGSERKQEYGMTLLHLVKQRNHARFMMGTAMSGEKSMIRERISFLSKPFYGNKRNAIICLFVLLFLIMFSFLRPRLHYVYQSQAGENMIVDETEDMEVSPVEKDPVLESKISIKNIDNNCYNFIKNYENKLYYVSSGYLCSYDLETNVTEQLISGSMRLGNISDDYLFYVKYPINPELEAGIGRLNLVTLEEQMLLPWKDAYWNCVSVLMHDDHLYLEVGNSCEAYLLEKGTAIKLEKEENMVDSVVERFDLSMEEAYGINNYFVNSVVEYSAFTILNSNSHELYICDAKSGSVIKKENCLGNILVSDVGIIHTTLEGNIILNRWENLV